VGVLRHRNDLGEVVELVVDPLLVSVEEVHLRDNGRMVAQESHGVLWVNVRGPVPKLTLRAITQIMVLVELT
jgi:hypothetical protein